MAVKYDLAIIGGGPGGYTAALKAASLGLSLIHIFSSCPLEQCLPLELWENILHIIFLPSLLPFKVFL